MRAPIALLACLLAACAPTLPAGWHDPAALPRPTAADVGDAEAVVVRADEDLLYFVAHEETRYQVRRHVVIDVVARGGGDRARVVLDDVPDHQRLVTLMARVIEPGGAVREIDTAPLIARPAEAKDVDLGVPPGGRLEYVYVAEQTERVPEWRWNRASDDLPVLDYRLSIRGTDVVAGRLQAYQDAEGLKTDRDGDLWRVTWRARNVPPRRDEDLAPHWAEREPWWHFRVAAYQWPGWTWDAGSDWQHALRDWVRPFLRDEAKLVEGFAAPVDVAACAGVACRVDRVVAWVRDTLAHSGFEHTPRSRRLAEVVRSGQADNHELAFVTWQALRRAGVDAHLVGLAMADSIPLDPAFPADLPLNHHVVLVPPQGDLAGPRWIDPTCTWCAPGELPPWSVGRLGVRLGLLPGVDARRYLVDARLVTLEAPRAAPSGQHLRYVARVDETRLLSLGVEYTRRGAEAAAQERETRRWQPRDWERRVRAIGRPRGEDVEVAESPPGRCERVGATCAQAFELRMADYARQGEGRLDVPLRFLHTDLDDRLRGGRRFDLVLSDGFERREEAIVQVPAGFGPAFLPAGRKLSAEGVTFTFEAEARPDGIRLVRTLTAAPGRVPAARYEAVRAVLDAYRQVRREALVFHRAERGWALLR